MKLAEKLASATKTGDPSVARSREGTCDLRRADQPIQQPVGLA